jgi:DNA-binding transcriptional MerR regulator
MSNIVRIPKAYSEEQAARLARVSIGQLRYWDSTEFFQPSIAFEDRRAAFSRIFSFEDVVALRVLGELRNEHDVSLQHLRRVRDKFRMPQSAWADEEIFVHRKRVYFKNERGTFTSADTGEETLPNIPLPKVIAEVYRDAEALRIRPADAVGAKTRSQKTARRAEVFMGTRIPIDMVKEYFQEGFGVDDILRDYPTLREEDIRAAIRWLGVVAA